jgi:hypothetical protein
MRAYAGRVAASSVLVLLAATGCGGSSVEDYCAQLDQDRTKLADIVSSESPTALLTNLPLLRGLAEKSPEDLADEWQTFIGALEGLDRALDRAGVKPSAFVGGKPPAGLSASDRQQVADAAAQIETDDVVAAVSGIEQQGRDVCKVNLGL